MVAGRKILTAGSRVGVPVRYSEVLRCWQHDHIFRAFFIALLADSSLLSYRWETPPITKRTADQEFKFVLIEAPDLDVEPDAQAFAEHFPVPDKDESVVTFPNLRNDAVLVVPCPLGPQSAYAHLGAFIRTAPDAQRHQLWCRVGMAMEARLGTEPVWLSTAGLGVSWLHVRLDSRPKYYS